MNDTHAQLLAAAKAGDVAGVQAALDKGAQVDARDQVSACTSSPQGERRAREGGRGAREGGRIEW